MMPDTAPRGDQDRITTTAALTRRRMLATLARPFALGYSCCYRCHMPWKFAEHHTTWYGGNRGCFPLCEPCWAELTPEERLPFYDQLIRDWHADQAVDGAQAEAIIGAVLAGA